MSKEVVTITGLDDVLRNLAKLDADMRGSAMKQMLSAAAEQAEGHVKVNAREEFYDAERGQTGNLMNSIMSGSSLAGDESIVYVGAEYGVYLEMGTTRGIKPRHYVYRGVVEHLSDIGQAVVVTAKRILGL